MSFLPKLRNTSAPSKVEEVRFYGIDRTESARGGYFSDTKNVTSIDFPFISSRNPRNLYKLPDGMAVLGAYSAKKLCFILGDGNKSYFYFDGEIKGEWEDKAQKEKFLCELGGAVYIFPDRKFFKFKQEKAIEEYKASHPRVGQVGEGYIKFEFGGSGYQAVNRNNFKIKEITHDFDVGDAISLYGFDKNTGERVSLYNLPSGVVMAGKDSFESVYVYQNNLVVSNMYQTYTENIESSFYDYIKIQYEFTYPAQLGEEFGSFSGDITANEVYKDDEGNQYLIIEKEMVPGTAVSSDLKKEFLDYAFSPGMTIHFGFTDESLKEVLPESAVLSDCGVEKFYKSNNYITAAYLKFPPDTFKIDDTWVKVTSGNIKEYVILRNSGGNKVYVTSSAKYPSLQGAVCVNNRLWGYEGNTIYASSLGKPYILGAYKGLSTDSWALETGIKRNFTGVIEYGGIPHYFTEEKIIKVYGDAPSSFRTAETECAGVKSGAQKSLCVCGGALHYLDKDGFIAAYTGSYPSVISRKLNEEFVSGITVSDERFIYCVLKAKDKNSKVYVFDTLSNIWLCEGQKDAVYAVYHGGSVHLFKDGFIECTESTNLPFEEYLEAPFESMIEFPVNDEGIFNQKKLKKILLKVNAEIGTSLLVEVRETESPEYARVFERVIKDGDGVLTIPVDCRRTLGYQIRISGKGKWRLEGIMRRVAIGSYKS